MTVIKIEDIRFLREKYEEYKRDVLSEAFDLEIKISDKLFELAVLPVGDLGIAQRAEVEMLRSKVNSIYRSESLGGFLDWLIEQYEKH